MSKLLEEKSKTQLRVTVVLKVLFSMFSFIPVRSVSGECETPRESLSPT